MLSSLKNWCVPLNCCLLILSDSNIFASNPQSKIAPWKHKYPQKKTQRQDVFISPNCSLEMLNKRVLSHPNYWTVDVVAKMNSLCWVSWCFKQGGKGFSCLFLCWSELAEVMLPRSKASSFHALNLQAGKLRHQAQTSPQIHRTNKEQDESKPSAAAPCLYLAQTMINLQMLLMEKTCWVILQAPVSPGFFPAMCWRQKCFIQPLH